MESVYSSSNSRDGSTPVKIPPPYLMVYIPLSLIPNTVVVISLALVLSKYRHSVPVAIVSLIIFTPLICLGVYSNILSIVFCLACIGLLSIPPIQSVIAIACNAMIRAKMANRVIMEYSFISLVSFRY